MPIIPPVASPAGSGSRAGPRQLRAEAVAEENRVEIEVRRGVDSKGVQYNEERVKYWLGVGAQPTDRMARILSANGLAKWERGNNPKKAEPKAKAKERATAKADKAAKAAEGGEAAA